MRIKTIKRQYRRDFVAIFECEHCGHETEGSGYDDSYYHNTVVPNMKCVQCGLTADSSYRPLSTRYGDDVII